MNKNARIKKRLVLLIAFSIIWIFIGSLVIFHQEHVMGKTFKFHTISYIVPKSKDDKSFVKVIAKQSTSHFLHPILAILDDNAREKVLEGNYTTEAQACKDIGEPVLIDRSRPLRAPPLA